MRLRKYKQNKPTSTLEFTKRSEPIKRSETEKKLMQRLMINTSNIPEMEEKIHQSNSKLKAGHT